MLSKVILTTMFDYNAATNARLLDLAANLNDEQLDAPTEYSHGSLRKTLFHYLSVEWGWRYTFEHDTSPTSYPSIGPTATIADLQAFATEEAQHARALVDGLTEDELTMIVTRRRGGKESCFVRWHILMQILYHGAQHRSEVATLLTRHGYSPGDIDFIFFVRPPAHS